MTKQKKMIEISNNVHECGEEKIVLTQQDVSLNDISLSTDEINMVWNFYVSHAPIKKNRNEKECDFGCRNLAEFGWSGSKLTTLERALIKAADLGRFVMIKADEITETLKMMNLDEKICWKHPRAVLKQNFTVKVYEDGEVNLKESETRMVCLFRHIRNALAHNRIYFSKDYTMILLEDIESVNKKLTARILIPARSLVDWIAIVDKDKKFYYKEQYADILNREAPSCPA